VLKSRLATQGIKWAWRPSTACWDPAPGTIVEQQHRIVGVLDAMQAQLDALKHLQAETATELEALMPAILDRAFKGEL
jgi:hypothetical protein